MTPDYEKSENCKLEVQYAQKRGKPFIPCILGDATIWKPPTWLESIIRELKPIVFHDVSEENIRLKTQELAKRIEQQCISTPHLTSQSVDDASYLFELIKHEYKRNSRIRRFMNPVKSFPIEDSYINLTIIETKQQREKEKKLSDAKYNDKMTDTFEEIYNNKSLIHIKDLFEYCKEQLRQVLVFGRAGIGKTTFCQYTAHQWARGKIWSEYDLIVLFPLRLLTETRYPPLSSTSYSLIDVVEKEYFSNSLSEKEKQMLKNQLDRFKVLWLLDGYDEIIQNVPSHLQCLFEQMLKTPHHIVTSRPYSNTLSNKVQMEITGFTDSNISKYMTQFFDQIKEELDDASSQGQKCLEFLKMNPRIWGIAHIPVNLELICSIWSNTNWSETTHMTIAALYDDMTMWICRRYLEKKSNTIEMTKKQLYEYCNKELTFLETLAFDATVKNKVLIRKELLQKVIEDTECSFQAFRQILNIGIIKSYETAATGSQVELDKHHYFVHLSYQEYFAARHLCKALKDPPDQRVIGLIQTHKYDRHFSLMLTFASGLLNNADDYAALNRFWDLIHNTDHRDLIGFRHLQLLIPCIDEGRCSDYIEIKDQIIQYITNWIQYIFSLKCEALQRKLRGLLRTCTSLAEQSTIQNILLQQLQAKHETSPEAVLLLISEMTFPDSSSELFSVVSRHLDDQDSAVRCAALPAWAKLGEKAATNEVISRLVISLRDSDKSVRWSVCRVLGGLSDKAATNEVISQLIISLGDSDRYVRLSACEALGRLGEKAAANEIISHLLISLGDREEDVRSSAREALGRLGENAAMNEVISRLMISLGDSDTFVRSGACEALGSLGEKAATNEVISQLIISLGDSDKNVRRSACRALGRLGEKAATNEVISRLVISLGDSDWKVRLSACEALGRLGEKAATSEIINGLVISLGDSDRSVRLSACEALGRLGEKAATSEVISRLVISLGDSDKNVRFGACYILGRLGENAATSEVISRLVISLGDSDRSVRSSACEALGRLGEKAATSEVISRLVISLGDSDWKVRLSACEALGRLGEKAATSEIINGLVISLGDSDRSVRLSACEALGRLGEKAATSEVISRLVISLGDSDKNVRFGACYILGRLGENAATSEVISRLMISLGDSDKNVRYSACEALGELGEKAATSEVISRLVISLGDSDKNVRFGACYILGRLGENAATSEVISRLVISLGDSDRSVRSSACEALGRLCEKAATSEVISRLVISLGDSDWNVRSSAYEALGRLGEKAATSEVISRLVISLGDSDRSVRSSACEALGRLGEKAATSEVISQLVILLEDSDWNVRLRACDALGRLGEKAATSEIINQLLVISLGDSYEAVRESACYALGRLGEKAATNEVISRLVISLGDMDENVRRSACEVLRRLGEKAATSEVISKLTTSLGDNYLRLDAARSVNQLVSMLLRGKVSEDHLSTDSSEHLINERKLIEDSNICMKLFELLLKSEDTSWISACFHAAVFQNCYAIIIENRIVVGSDSHYLKIDLSDNMMREILKGFDDLWPQVTNVYEVGDVVLERKWKGSHSLLSYCNVV